MAIDTKLKEMQMYTTYASALKHINIDDFTIVRICRLDFSTPTFKYGIAGRELMPNKDLFDRAKGKNGEEPISHEQYKKEYFQQLSKLHPEYLLERYSKIANGAIPNSDGYSWEYGTLKKSSQPCKPFLFVCLETPEKFCHRHLVAEWLTAWGYKIKELEVNVSPANEVSVENHTPAHEALANSNILETTNLFDTPLNS